MEHFVKIYCDNPLFAHVPQEALLPLLECLQAQKRSFAKGEIIFAADTRATQLGIVLTGRVYTMYEDMLGGRSILDTMEPGRLFCEAFSCTQQQHLPVSIAAQTDCTVLLIDTVRILHTCANACRQHQQLCENLVHILAEKYTAMSHKVIHLSGRTTRRKLLSYLSEQMRLAGGNPFALPFNRQELADYLFIERSGLSTELNKLQKEGILQFDNGMCSLQIPFCTGADCDG